MTTLSINCMCNRRGLITCSRAVKQSNIMFLYLIITIFMLIYFVTTRKYNYWKNKNVPHIKPTFLIGNYGAMVFMKKNIGQTIRDLCLQFPDEKFIGAFNCTEPVLIPIDPDIIKLILTKDFYFFHGRELSKFSDKEPAALNLFGIHGDIWRVLRQNMTPLFSSAKLKNKFHLIEKCSHELELMLDRETSISKELEARTVSSRYTIDCIAACDFGVDAKAMEEEVEENPFRQISGIESSPKLKFYMRLLRTIWPTIFYTFGFQVFKNQLEFFKNLLAFKMKERKNKSSGRNDFVDLAISWKNNGKVVGDQIINIKTGGSHKCSLEAGKDLLAAQSFIFFTAGLKTSSTTLSYTLYELAKNQDIQNKVLAEVDEYLIRHENKLNYDCFVELPYLESVIDETLRLYPALAMIPRELMENYTMPGGVQIDKGMRVHLPVYYLHQNSKYYPEPEVFRPERFLGEEKRKINPYTYLPFGQGPRICIGMRFAKILMLAGLVTILKKYHLELADGMPRSVKLKPNSLNTHPVEGIRLNFLERDGWANRIFVK